MVERLAEALSGLDGVSISALSVLSIRRIDRAAALAPDGVPDAAAGRFREVSCAEGLRIASLAPGEWILLGAPNQLAAIAGRNRVGFLCSDISDGRLVLHLDSECAARALPAFCPLDHARDLAPGRAAASLFGDMDAIFLAEQGGSILMIVDRSYGDYAGHLLRSLRSLRSLCGD